MVCDLSIIIVSWNVIDLLRCCLNSIPDGGRGLAYEVIVVDNASSDGSAQMVRSEFPAVEVIANTSNEGYARANNQGIRSSKGRYVVLLNGDTVIPPDALARLVAIMDTHTNAGASSPRLLCPDGSPQRYAFGSDPTPLYLLRRGFRRLLFHRPLHDWATEAVQVVDWVSGACIIVRSQTIAQVGLLDEGFFMYFEDNDWCLRMRQAGWQVLYCPEVEITHIGGQSLAKNPRALSAYNHSLRRFYRKHYGRLANSFLSLGLWVYHRLSHTEHKQRS